MVTKMLLLLFFLLATSQLSVNATFSSGVPLSPRACGEVEPNFAPVSNLNLDASTEDFVLTWEPPEGYEDCQLAYRVEVNSNLFQEAIASTFLTIPGFILVKCLENEVVVTPVIDGTAGVPKVLNEIAIVDDGFWLVEALDLVEENRQLKASWSLSSGFPECSISYEIQLDSEVIKTTEDTEYVFETPTLISCVAHRVTVTPIIFETRGLSRSDEYTSEPGFVGHPSFGSIVLNDNDTFTASWRVPDGLDNCALTYEVILSLGGTEILRDWVQTAYWTSTRPFLYYCVGFELQFMVTANYNGLPNRGYIFARSCHLCC